MSFSSRLRSFIIRRRITWLGLALALVFGVATMAVIFVSATATPPAASQARLANLVDQLRAPQLTAARHRAQQALEQAGPAAVDPLISGLRSSDAVLRGNSAEMLGYVASPRALEPLAFALESDSSAAVRKQAAWSLGELKEPRAISSLERASMLDRSVEVRQAAEASLAALRAEFARLAGRDDRLVNVMAAGMRDPDTVFLAEMSQLSVSRDGALSWTNMTPALSSRITALATSPDDPSIVYAGTESLGLYKSKDGGASWQELDEGLGLEPGVRVSVTAIAVAPRNGSHLFVAVGKWVGGSHMIFIPSGILESSDGGAEWHPYASNVGSVPIKRLLFDAGRLYAETPTGVIRVASD